jgi:hypothetical protein
MGNNSSNVRARLDHLEHSVDKERQEKFDYKTRVQQLEVMVADLKIINSQLEKRLMKKKQVNLKNKKAINRNVKLTDISNERINEMVERLIANKNINIPGFPDYIERHIYRNVFQILINLLDELLQTASVEFMGHQITMNLTPVAPVAPETINNPPETKETIEQHLVATATAKDDILENIKEPDPTKNINLDELREKDEIKEEELKEIEPTV